MPKWQFTGGGAASTPAVADGVVYVTSWNGNAYALDARTGDVRWQYNMLAATSGQELECTRRAFTNLCIADDQLELIAGGQLKLDFTARPTAAAA